MCLGQCSEWLRLNISTISLFRGPEAVSIVDIWQTESLFKAAHSDFYLNVGVKQLAVENKRSTLIQFSWHSWVEFMFLFHQADWVFIMNLPHSMIQNGPTGLCSSCQEMLHFQLWVDFHRHYSVSWWTVDPFWWNTHVRKSISIQLCNLYKTLLKFLQRIVLHHKFG